MDGDPWANFLIWERASRDTIDFKTIYVDMADDLVSGLLLSQIVYWYLPSKKGQSKLRVFKDGYYWIAKARHEWWDEIRVKTRQIDRAIAKLEEKGIIVSRLFRFNNAPTTHIRIIKEGFLAAWDNALARFDETVKSEIPADPFSPNRQFDFTDSSSGFDKTVKSDLPESVQSLTETTIDSTETTAENTSDFPEKPKERIDVPNRSQSEPVPSGLDEGDSEATDHQNHGPTVLHGGAPRHPGLSLPDGGRNYAAIGERPDPTSFDLDRRTLAKREEAGSNYAVPPSAGGDDTLAAFGLFCLYDKRGKAAPKQGTKEYRQQCEKVRESLRAYEYQQCQPEIVEKAAELFCERKGTWVNVFYRSFIADFGEALQDAEHFIEHGYLPDDGQKTHTLTPARQAILISRQREEERRNAH